MKTVYTPEEIERILQATIGPAKLPDDTSAQARKQWRQRRSQFIEQVGRQCAAEVIEVHADRSGDILIFAGDDLCGAYALATATSLHRQGVEAHVCLFNIGGDMLSDDCIAERKRLIDSGYGKWLTEVIDPGVRFTMPDIDADTTIVDGLFGTDYQKPLRGGYQAIARHINESNPHPTVVSIDIPSGMTLDLGIGMVNRNIIHADITLAIVGPTLAFFMPENAELLGRWKSLRLPLDKSVVRTSRHRVIDAKAIRAVLPHRSPFADKNDLGTALIYAGSYGMLGAAVLATRAATRSGCGKVICHGPRCGFYVMQSSVPSAMYETDGADFDIQRFETTHDAEAIAVGPGIGHSDATVYGLERFLKACQSQKRPLILDADALNCISQRPSMLDFIPSGSVITPHKREFDRLFGTQSMHSTRVLKALEMSARYRITIVLKGHYTLVIWPDGEVLVNASGNEALATAGSGDVLTGIIAGIMAQGIVPEIAAVAGTYIHGVAGKLAASTHGIYGTTADDIAQMTGMAIEKILDPAR